jgi:hypothetical protein
LHSENWHPKQHSRICAKHFHNSAFERQHLQELKNLKIRNFLTRSAVPTNGCLVEGKSNREFQALIDARSVYNFSPSSTGVMVQFK